jgi:hypothetical protein
MPWERPIHHAARRNAVVAHEGAVRAKQERIDGLHRLERGRTALLVIDMQRGFLEPGAALEVPPGRDVIPNLQRLVEASRQKGAWLAEHPLDDRKSPP